METGVSRTERREQDLPGLAPAAIRSDLHTKMIVWGPSVVSGEVQGQLDSDQKAGWQTWMRN